MTRLAHLVVTLLGASAVVAACAGEQRRPDVPPSDLVKNLRIRAGNVVQDCGQAFELRDDEACPVQPIGECVSTALKECRVAHGVRSYYLSEGDPVRVDWLVLRNDRGTCDLVKVEDFSSDPLARNRITIERCRGVQWKTHPDIADCLLPVPEDCLAEAAPAR